MNRLIFFICSLLILAGCASEGEIKIINRTDHKLFFTLEGNDYILEGSETSDPSQSIDIDTGKQFLFWGDEETKVPMRMEGETFMMQWAENSGVSCYDFYTETTLYVQPDKTLNIYCDATHAGVKLVNNSLKKVDYLSYYTDDNDTLKTLNVEPIYSGDEFWSRLTASTVWDSIIYSFVIEFEDNTIDDSHANIDWLNVDVQYLIELE